MLKHPRPVGNVVLALSRPYWNGKAYTPREKHVSERKVVMEKTATGGDCSIDTPASVLYWEWRIHLTVKHVTDGKVRKEKPATGGSCCIVTTATVPNG